MDIDVTQKNKGIKCYMNMNFTNTQLENANTQLENANTQLENANTQRI